MGTDKARRTALDKLPRGLPKTYERISEQILETHQETQDRVKRALQWLAVAPTLSGRALLETLALRPGYSRLAPEAMTSEEDILKWCSSFVRRRANGNGLELAHFTVKEYLMCIDPANDPRVGRFKISELQSHLLIGKTCPTYLTLDAFADTSLPVNLLGNMCSDIGEDIIAVCADSAESMEDEGSDEESDENHKISSLSAGVESDEEEPKSPRFTHDTRDTYLFGVLTAILSYCTQQLAGMIIATAISWI